MGECKQCGSCCCHLPGFFEPDKDEILDEVAKYLKLSVEELKNKYLMRDYRAPFGKKIWFWTPRMVDREGKALLPEIGEEDTFLAEYPQRAEKSGREGGHCIFFSPSEGGCLIHPVKPFSCRLYNCGEEEITANWIYFHYFGGEPSFPGEKIKISQGDWATCWDFFCPKCGQDEAVYTGNTIPEDSNYHEVVCENCGYQFWVY